MKNIQEHEKHYFSKSGLRDLKSDIELVFAIGAAIKLLKKGKRFFGHCPVCEDKKLSLVISPKLNLWYCYGKCKKGGSIIDWVMAKEKLRLVEALAMLAERWVDQRNLTSSPPQTPYVNLSIHTAPPSHSFETSRSQTDDTQKHSF